MPQLAEEHAVERAVLTALIETRRRLSRPELWHQDRPWSNGRAYQRVLQSGAPEEVVVMFNETPGRTHAEVLELVDRTIARQRARLRALERR
jgi:hypothetical protein